MRQSFKFVHSCRLPVHSFRRGQTLVEVIISVAVAVALSVSLITVTLMTQRASRSARNNTQASKLVQEYLEQIRVYRDRKGYAALASETGSTTQCYKIDFTSNPDPLLWDISSSFSCTNTSGELKILSAISFYRRFSVSNIGSNKRQVTVIVSWGEQGVTKTATGNTFVSDWEGIQ